MADCSDAAEGARGLGQGGESDDPGGGAPGMVEFHVVGDAFVDVLASGVDGIPAWGSDARAAGVHLQPGGSALNTAVHLASLAGSEAQVFFYACVGDDDFAALLRGRLECAGVLPRLAVVPGAPTGSCVILSGAGDRAFITCAGASAALAAEHLADDLLRAVRRCEADGRRVHLHLGGFYSYGPLRHEASHLVGRLRSEAEDGRSAAADLLTVSADVQGSRPEDVDGFADLLGALDVLKANQAEAAAVTGAGEDAAPEEVAALLQRVPGLQSLVTLGAAGAIFCGPGALGRAQAPQVEVCDTTGAGDACAAGLLLALTLRRQCLADAAEFACLAGAANCTRLGGSATPVTASELERV